MYERFECILWAIYAAGAVGDCAGMVESNAYRNHSSCKSLYSLIGVLFILFALPLWAFSVYAGFYDLFSLHQSIFIFLLCSVLIYARFIEPHTVLVKTLHYQFNPQQPFQRPVRIALIADLHIGLFSGHERQLKIIVEKINQQQPDLVVVAGDWTYEPENKLADELKILQQIQAPIYSVTGNHDEQYPGPPIQQLLSDALNSNNVIDIEKKSLSLMSFV